MSGLELFTDFDLAQKRELWLLQTLFWS